ncbi:hypothetical protein BU24DRAFT_441549 [Aaosphaeria arxii CBS 175.79]|uniref:Rhodopsin domain-containing protein n=1 Tax=Aaosphaeria arxii CBS 175.79 TaxID=1450172 RepID=A0A6A5XT15_9PLEO|nr:uncharacterized protein BU24DRAFT_441549 [Aaosphaeria arxii CBS 175.79]KAF2016342.1 hypothetical protein BU24DRAFT_441549 [Aaosphaeria arxii CBS 175.79]
MAVDYFSNPPPGLDVQESRTVSNNATGIVLFILSAIFVGLRLITRLRFQRAGLGLDDYLMFIGLALNAGNLACCIAGGFFGLGKHIYVLTPYEMRKITIITFAYVYIYAWSVCTIKYSIIALYRRIFGMSWMGWWCVFLTTGYLIANHIVLPLYTKPLSYYWDQWYGAEGVLQVDEAKFYLGIGITNLIGDICILMVPVRNVWMLNMTKTAKVAVFFMFGLGSFVCFASLYRIVTIVHLTQTTDISWAKSDVFIWSSVEPSIGIISGCLPTLRPLLMFILRKYFGHVPAPRKRLSRGDGSQPLDTLETISKKSTRKPSRMNDLEETRMGDEDDDNNQNEGQEDDHSATGRLTTNGQHTQEGSLRPDRHEMCFTTTVIEGTESKTHSRHGGDSPASREEPSGITVSKEFNWGEGTR